MRYISAITLAQVLSTEEKEVNNNITEPVDNTDNNAMDENN